jgi:hypothetical protein
MFCSRSRMIRTFAAVAAVALLGAFLLPTERS